MKIFLAGTGSQPWVRDKFYSFNRLHSFHYIGENEAKLINKYNNFLLDSGAFTYMNNPKNKIDWDKYIVDYANFINKYNVEYFFELDIDVVVGIKEVERLRNKLEKLTNKKCIPVWHKSRGKEYWINLCNNYNYIAIGGIVTKEIKTQDYPIIFPWLLNEAKKANCKVHALGFTRTKELEKYNFYSVDSTSWTSGTRFGRTYIFNGITMEQHTKKPNLRVKSNLINKFNFYEWVRYSKLIEGKGILNGKK